MRKHTRQHKTALASAFAHAYSSHPRYRRAKTKMPLSPQKGEWRVTPKMLQREKRGLVLFPGEAAVLAELSKQLEPIA